MHKIVGVFAFLFFSCQQLKSQVIPTEGSQLNYRLVGFSFPAIKGTTEYGIEIAKGSYNSEDSFRQNMFKKESVHKNEMIAEVPGFGCNYTWRAVYTNARKKTTRTSLYHFSTMTIPETDTTLFRLKVTTEAKQYKDAYVFVDANRTMYDMNGKPVWFLPYVEGNNAAPRDLKMSAMGTITFLVNKNAYEVNYNGDVLWKGPDNGSVSGDTQEYYHHELTRLSNGHYMVLGSEKMFIKLPSRDDSTMRFIPIAKIFRGLRNSTFKSTELGTVIEYDDKNNVVWSWKSSGYFASAVLERYGSRTDREKLYTDVHENAFYFDNKSNYLYVSFKNLNQIIKVKYPEGTVENEYGHKYDPADPLKPNKLFCGQHSVNTTQKGYLVTYNNNDCNPTSPAKIVMLQEPAAKNGKLKKIWEFECPEDDELLNMPVNTPLKFKSTVGGNVIELPDQSIFASMSSYESRVFIVSLNKEILWSATAEKWNSDTKKWEANTNAYRANIILNKERLAQLIRGEEHNKK